MKLPVGFTLLLGMLLAGTASAQTFNASYTYDANGNRVKASIVYLSQAKSSAESKVKEEIAIDPLTNLTVSIFPNPTQGDLRIDFAGVAQELIGDPGNAIKVWDMQGRMLITISPVEASNSVNLSGARNGTYILQLFFKGKVTDYKVIKN